MTLQADQRLSHYRLVERIGEGGMGVVWKAEDTVLGRHVAIKVLPPDVSRDDRRREMFLQEAKLASSLSDAHIVHVNELGREGDLDFIVMEFVEGRPLGKILHGRPLPPYKVAELGLQVASALASAHRKGLIHRDIKPANLLVTTDGDIKVVDFGLAALFEPAGSSAGPDDETVPEGSWRTGGSVPDLHRGGRREIAGTLPYMAPEQILRERPDTRSDVFSLGVVLYEMTTGRRPFEAPDTAGLVKEIVRGRVTPVHEVVPKVPLELDRIIHKALSPKKADRYQTMEDLAVDLRRLGKELESGSSPSYESVQATLVPPRRRLVLGAAFVAVLAVTLGVTGWQQGWWATSPPLSERTILVLPLEVRGQEEGADYVGRAFAEALVVNLAQYPDLKVLAVPRIAGNPTDNAMEPAQMGAGVGAGRVVSGSLTRQGASVEASLGLIDTGTSQVVWGGTERGGEQSLSTLAERLASGVAVHLGAVRPALYGLPEEQVLLSPMAGHPAALETLSAWRDDDYERALLSATRLVQRFSDDFAAHALRGDILVALWLANKSPEHLQALEEELTEMRRLDPGSPIIDLYETYRTGETEPRVHIENLTASLERDDLSGRTRSLLMRRRGGLHSLLGEHVEALGDTERALKLNPTSRGTNESLARALSRAGRHEESIRWARQAVALAPNYWSGYQRLGFSLERTGRIEEALAAHQRACELAEGQEACSGFVIVLQKNGREEEAAEWSARVAEYPGDHLGAYNLACYHALAGHRDQALLWLREALDRGYSSFWITKDTDLDSLRGDPEFEAIVTEVKTRVEAEP